MDELVLDMQDRMNKSIDSLKQSLTSLRTGKATPAMLNGIEVDYYGTMTPINQMSSVSVPEPRQLLIKPYDKNDIKAILTAITLICRNNKVISVDCLVVGSVDEPHW